MTGKKSCLFPGKSAKPDSSNINPSSSNNAAPSSSQGTGTSFALPITSQANTHPAQDEISEVGPALISDSSGMWEVGSALISDSSSLAHAGRDKVAEIGSPSIPSATSPEKLRDHAEREANKGLDEESDVLHEGSDVADLYAAFDLISQLADFIKKEKLDEKKMKEKKEKKEKEKKSEENKKEKEKENELSEPKLDIHSWLRSKNLLEMKEEIYEAINAAKDSASRRDVKEEVHQMVRRALKFDGKGQQVFKVFNIVFIVVANTWERYEGMSKNEEACLSLLEEINKFAKYVIDLQKVLQNGPESKEGMEGSVKEAIELIIDTCIACCTQIEASKRRRYLRTIRAGHELAKLKKKLQKAYTRIQRQTGIRTCEAVHKPRPHDTVGTKKPVQLRKPDYPEYAKDAGKSSSSRLRKESDYAETIMEAAKELDKENVDGDFSDLINYISRLFDFIEEKEKEKEKKEGANSPSKPEATRNYWPGSKFFSTLKEVLAEGIEGMKDVPTGDANKIARDIVKHMGMAHLVTTGFLVLANILERYEAISTNKGVCLSVLKEMDKLARHVNELRKRPVLKESMVDSIREAIALIVEASLACCTQINATKFSKFFSTTMNGEELAKIKTRLAEADTHMQRNFYLCLYDAIVRRQKPMELQYPEHPKGPVGIEKQLEKVIEMLEMGSDKNAVAVIVHGFGGMGKTTLADAVFARLLNAEIEGYKYSYVRLFDDIASPPNIVELQKFIIEGLKMGEESKEFRWYEEGQQQIESILAKEVVLIYIDNVLLEQNRNALEELLPKNMGNARKLRLLFTARDKDAVRISGVKPVFYPIEGIPHEEALELFKKTLDGDSLQQLHPNQLKQLVKICEGVPKLIMVVAGFINAELESKQKAYEAVMEESQKNWNGEIGNEIKRYVFA